MLQHVCMCTKDSISSSSPWYWWRFDCHCDSEAAGRSKPSCFLHWTQTVKLAVVLHPAVLCFYWWACSREGFLEVCWLLGTSVGDWNGASLNRRSLPHVKCVLVSLSELQIFFHPVLCPPLPHCGHWQPCLSPSSLVLSRMGGPNHFSPRAI